MIYRGSYPALGLLCFFAWIAIGLSGCANKFSNETLEPVSTKPTTSSPHTVLVATNRQRVKEEDRPYFLRERNKETSFAKFVIAVPDDENHKTGKIEVSRRGRGKPDKHFVSTDSKLLDGQAEFRDELRQQIQSRESKTLIIFVHGVKVRFAQSVLYVAQMDHDAEFLGTAVVMAWPSGGRWRDYVYDRESIMTARNSLEKTIEIGSQAGAERILIIAHSLGSYLTMETLRQKAIRDGDPTFGNKLQGVILAAPDVSVDVFKSQVRDIGKRPKITVQQSAHDGILPLAKLVTAGSDRIGNYKFDKELLEYGVTSVDMKTIDATSEEGHWAAFANPKVLRKIFEQMEENRGMSSNQLLANNPEVLRNVTQAAVQMGGAIATAPLKIIEQARGRVEVEDPSDPESADPSPLPESTEE